MEGRLAMGAKSTREVPGQEAFVVDDDKRVRQFVASVLTGEGFISREFSRIAEVEAALAQQRPAVIVLDLSLGESDAVEAIRSLASARFAGKVLLVSGHDHNTIGEVSKIGERHGLAMLPFLHKPFRVEQLRERLAHVTTPNESDSEFGLEAALRNDWLELWYQPKIDLHTMLVCGAEALIRLRHPERGVLQPADFLPAAGDPLYRPLTDFVVRRALTDWSAFAADKIVNRLAINVPASILQSADFVANVRRHLPAHPKFPGLIVEITEDEAMENPELAREMAVQLKLYNVHVAIDDFGAGYSSLSRLKELPFVELKIDRKFVSGCAAEKVKQEMCRNVLELAHRSKITAVAEGIETRADLDVIKNMGYDVAQGFVFAKPMIADDFVKNILSHAA
jgi:EAL domain-containing protein (putative c-di-GMP-specific phosphodiesterase class I)/CheY-like chemotaxis protein